MEILESLREFIRTQDNKTRIQLIMSSLNIKWVLLQDNKTINIGCINNTPKKYCAGRADSGIWLHLTREVIARFAARSLALKINACVLNLPHSQKM